MGTIVLVRHGETAWNSEGRSQGWAPTHLNERGRRQARKLAAALDERYDIDHIRASDLLRTKETTQIIRETVSVPVRYDDAWREQDIGVLQGFEKRTLREQFPEYAIAEAGQSASKRTPESGEAFEAACGRIRDAWESVIEQLGADETVLVVAHGGSIRIALGEVLGLSIEEGVEDIDQDNAAINEIRFEDGETAVHEQNETSYRRDDA